MDEIIKNILNKISSYEIFNNLIPGFIFCFVVKKITCFCFDGGTLFENLIIYYFIGMILSRIGSIIIAPLLLKIKKKKSDNRFIEYSKYEDYIEASESQSFIKTLNETNNTYRTMISTFVVIAIFKLYDWLLYDKLHQIGECFSNVLIIIICLFVAVLFVISYRKQSKFIKSRVEKYKNDKKKNSKKEVR